MVKDILTTRFDMRAMQTMFSPSSNKTLPDTLILSVALIMTGWTNSLILIVYKVE